MTAPDLDELKRLAKEATPGPWMAAAKPSSVVGWPVVSQTGRVICDVNYVQHSQIDLPVPGDRAFNTESKANAHLIAAAVNSLPAFMAIAEEVERLREVLQAMVDAEVDYMTRNNLGDPEKQHNVKWARAVLEGRRS